MIVAEQKPFQEIFNMVKGHDHILVIGCGTCMTVCMAGGENEVSTLSKQLQLAAKQEDRSLSIEELTVTRQCDQEFFDEEAAVRIKEAGMVLSLGCGVGVQYMVELFPDTLVKPGVDTRFFGANISQGVWSERCAGCGECILDEYEGVCPIARCSKSLMNGPCGGSSNGMCEIDPENTDCGWQLIYDRFKRLDMLDKLLENKAPKDWSVVIGGTPGGANEDEIAGESEVGQMEGT
ncbi:MAG: methylenetetrahydrofolate reductase C-terminal domain-containing protein [Bacteroidales bacterium]